MLTVYSLEQSAQWDEAVRSVKGYDVYWLSGYARALQVHGDGEPLLFYFHDNHTRGVNVVMKRDIALDERFRGKIPQGRYFDFSTPYGYGGWLIEGENTAGLFAAYGDWAAGHGIVSEFVRFHPMLGNADRCRDFYRPVYLRHTVGNLLAGCDDPTEAQFSKEARKKIRKLLHKGLTVRLRDHPESLDAFLRVYEPTMSRNRASQYYFFEDRYFRTLLDGLREHVVLAEVTYADTLIAAGLFLTGSQGVNFHLTGTLDEYLKLSPEYLIRYGITQWAKQHGFSWIHNGGGRGNAPDDSLYLFKRQFGEDFDFCVARRIWDEGRYNQLVQFRREDPAFCATADYFPLYRAD